jgi:glucose-1-phosphate adenylyltransferase
MITTHVESKADVTIAALPVPRSMTSGLGIMRADDSGRVIGFLEKPQSASELEHVRVEPSWIDRRGIASRGREYLASMGIYLFNRQVLLDALDKTLNYQDFGREVFPAAIRSRHVQVHLFDGYWEDIGTIKSFYDANLALVRPDPPFSLLSPTAPIYSRPRFLPPTRIDGATIRNSLIADGCVIEKDAVIENSIIGLRCHIRRGATIQNSILIGADEHEAAPPKGAPPLGIGMSTLVNGAIVDKNCRIGAGCRVANDARVESTPDRDDAVVREGIVVVQKEATLPDGWNLNVR